MSNRVLIAGSAGQLGNCLECLRELPKIEIRALDLPDIDITSEESVMAMAGWNPDYVVNAAAYTAVDAAEENAALAHAVNVVGVANLAKLCDAVSAKLIHISTDYVFDGAKGESDPWYTEDSPTNPLSVYGKTKLEGEQVALALADAIVLRTSGVYSPVGKNFIKTMLRLSEGDQPLRVVDDQLGNPTSAADLARVIKDIIAQEAHTPGLFHAASPTGASWWDLASETMNLSGASKEVEPIPTSEFPLPAKRPADARMSSDLLQQTYHTGAEPWRDALAKVVKELTR